MSAEIPALWSTDQKVKLPACERLLVTFGVREVPAGIGSPATRVYVDYERPGVEARFRHSGSILLSMLSWRLRP